MSKFNINFYSYKPRVRFSVVFRNTELPMVGDIITANVRELSQISEKRRKFLYGRGLDFKVVKRILGSLWGSEEYSWEIKLELNDNTLSEIDKYIEDQNL